MYSHRHSPKFPKIKAALAARSRLGFVETPGL
jgi:hypothetical protein